MTLATSVVTKRLMELIIVAAVLALLSPLLTLIALAVYLYDFHSPFYIAPRVGRGGRIFQMVKFRSMMVNADRTGVTSTSANDARITPIGRYIRALKLDEFVQCWNVLRGDMALVGPRPNVPSGVAVYTSEELRLLTVRPGITDFASIVFADEGDILNGRSDPDAAYDQLIRPWKSRLGLFYIDHRSLWLDLMLMHLTLLSIVSRTTALNAVARALERRVAGADLIRVARRQEQLMPCSPPGATAGFEAQPDAAS